VEIGKQLMATLSALQGKRGMVNVFVGCLRTIKALKKLSLKLFGVQRRVF
jgi:hypothetical protein